MSLNAIARRFVESHDAEDLLPMLGLVTEDGTTPPDDTNVYNFPPAGKGPGAKNPDAPTAKPTRDRSAVPPGLANLPPETAEEPVKKRRGPKPQPKVVRPRKEREVPPCGTYKAFSRHKRRIKAGVEGEVLDDACLEAGRAYSRNYQNDRNARIRKEKELKRLTDAGVNEATATVLSELAR